PFRCAFCEWGTGAIGTKMLSFPLERVRADFERIVRAGIPNIWLADSNFGALRDDLEKARLVCELKAAHGLPRSFATSWSKKHSPRVQEIVLMLHRHGLLPYYQLALQTLTPRALALCHRENMAANEYEPVAQRMAEAGVPISAELIWGLPGDDLASFEAGLGRLLAVFPDVNIFGYTLLPGTEFHDRREELQLQTVPVAGYGKAKGEYVVGSLSYPREEGEEGYLLISAHQWLVTGYALSRTVRWMALEGSLPVGPWLRFAARRLLAAFADALPVSDPTDRLQVYEARAAVYLALLAEPARLQVVLESAMEDWLTAQDAPRARQVLTQLMQLDAWIRPRFGAAENRVVEADFALPEVLDALAAMRLPDAACFRREPREYRLQSPGGLGVVLCSPDGGHWLQARLVEPEEQPLRLAADAALRLGV
ncbi:MAG: radical SAM protein, partial [Gammaproteobacteria bacterium]